MFNFKKKNLLGIILFMFMFLLLMMCFSFSSIKTYAATNKINSVEKDNIEKMIYDVAWQEGKEFNEFSYELDDVYFSNEEWGGYVVEFVSGNCLGYAIIFNLDGILKLVEINFNSHSPFYNKCGIKIYASLGCYYLKVDGKYIDAITMEELDEYSATEFPEFYAACSKEDKNGVATTRDISYSYGYFDNNYRYEIPNFYFSISSSLSDKKNNCANAAGAIMINYWNKKFDNKLLNLKDDEIMSSKNEYYNGNMNGFKAAEIMDTFYKFKYMNTNWFFGTGGTLPDDCYKGFEKMVTENGYHCTKNKNLKYEEMIDYIKAGTPIFITSTDYYFYYNSLPSVSSTPGENNLSITYSRTYGTSNSHTFVGYGYAYYNLYTNNGELYQEKLIKVADGWNHSCYFNFSASNTYSSAAIVVYK